MMDINQIKEVLPHRAPFLLIDRIDEIEEGNYAVGIKNVTYNEYFFQGHFPEEPVMPGVLIIEAMAQVGAAVLLKEEQNKGKIVYFGGIKNARFRKKVIPGDTLKMKVELVKIKGSVGIAKGTATVDDAVAADAEFTFVIQDVQKNSNTST